MRPRSRLLSKRGLLLPTIREGAEETLRDLNEANALHTAGRGPSSVSSEDYLLSICHLAHPTFPGKDVAPGNLRARQLDAVHQRLRLSRLSGATSAPPDLNPAGAARLVEARRSEDNKIINNNINKGVFGSSDPLEFLYGPQSDPSGLAACRAASVREALLEGRFLSRGGGRTWEGPARPRGLGALSSCPDTPCAAASAPNASPKSPGLEARRGAAVVAGGEAAEGARPNAGVKQSLISQWISDCRSAWREARVRACVLPAIAEI